MSPRDFRQMQAAAAYVKRMRAARGWSQVELAKIAGVSQATVSRVERAVCAPDGVTIGALSSALGLDDGGVSLYAHVMIAGLTR